MKLTKYCKLHYLPIIVTTLSLVTFSNAQSVYWDGTDTSANADGGDGTWDGSTTNWDDAATGGSDIAFLNNYNDLAVFGDTGGTVTRGAGALQTHLLTVTDSTAYTINSPVNWNVGITGYKVDSGSSLTIGGAGGLVFTSVDWFPTFEVDGDMTVNTALSGPSGNGLTKTGTGTLDIQMGSSYTGDTTINGGTLRLNNVADLSGITTSNFNINNGSTLEMTSAVGGANRTVFNNKTVTFGNTGGGTFNLAAGNHLFQGGSASHNIVTTGGTTNTFSSSGGGFANLQGAGTLTFDVADGTDAIDLNVTATINSGGIVKNGAGNLTLTGAKGTNLATTINAGTLTLGVGGSINNSTEIAIANGAVFQLGSGTPTDTYSFSNAVTGTGNVDGSFTASSASASIKPGDSSGADVGTLTFDHDLTFTGSTLDLQLQAALGTIPTTPGAFPDISLAMGGDAADPTSLMHDSIEVGGTLDLTNISAINLDFTGYSASLGDYFDLFDAATVLGADPSKLTTLPSLSGDLSWNTSRFDEGLLIVVPEPTTGALLGLGALGLLARRKRG